MALGSNVFLLFLNYHIWVVKMRLCLKFGLWDNANEGKQVESLRAIPTIAQIKPHEEEIMEMEKIVLYLHSSFIDKVFTVIMHKKKANEK